MAAMAELSRTCNVRRDVPLAGAFLVLICRLIQRGCIRAQVRPAEAADAPERPGGPIEHSTDPVAVDWDFDSGRDSPRSFRQLLLAYRGRQAHSRANPPTDTILELYTEREGFGDRLLGGLPSLRLTWESETDIWNASVYRPPRGALDPRVSLLECYGNLLASIADDPDAPIHTRSLLSTSERRRILIDWNATARPFPRDRCIHDVFEMRARSRPATTALVSSKEQVTYGDLNRRADALAARLQELGVSPGMLVAICAHRSVEMVVALLAILKAGGAYVPLDPAYPTQRLAGILRISRPVAILCQQQVADRLPLAGVPLVFLDGSTALVERTLPFLPRRSILATDPAYVMFTSGSTGEPKGVVVPHRAVVRLVTNVDYVRLGPCEVLLQLAPLSFDASTFEIWGALLNGARLVQYPAEPLSLNQLGRTLDVEQISTLWLPAALFEQVVHEELQLLRPVRQLLTGGDVVSEPAAMRVLRELPECAVLNCYGPTESTTFASCHRVRREDAGLPLPIGRPLPNTRLYILNDALDPLPVGVEGELCIGGDGLALEYLHDPALTASRFLLRPFANGAPERIYRTGDRARYRGDGTVEFLGRLDDQLKIRGYRIEPGEIESVLTAHPGVRQAVVISRGEALATRRLVAYVTPDADPRPSTAELAAFLRERLPDYMVPATLVMLDALPLTPGGKLDRKALALQKDVSPVALGRESATLDTLDATLRTMWEQLFEKPIAVSDNFFDLGGDSLLGAVLLARIEAQLGLDLPVSLLYDAPTVLELGRAVRGVTPGDAWVPLVPINARGTRMPFFCVHGLSGDVSSLFGLARGLHPEQPFYGLRCPGVAIGLAPSVEFLAQQYLEQVCTVQRRGPYALGGYSAGGIVAFEMAQQLARCGEPIALLLMIDAAAPPLLIARSGELGVDGATIPASLRVDASQRLSHPVHELLHEATAQLADPSPYAERRRRFMVSFYEALLRYVPEQYDGEITLFETGEGAPKVSSEPVVGWPSLTNGRVAVHRMPGNHLTMLRLPHVERVAVKLQECLHLKADAAVPLSCPNPGKPA
jgi:amino acid adenylation domain-containing protein